MTKQLRKPSLFESFVPILFLIVALSINVTVFGDAGLEGSNQIILVLATAIATLVALRLGMHWKTVLSGMVDSVGTAMSSIMILLMIGALSGTWLLSGIVPAMIYYGLQILNPTIFLFAACIVCAVVSIATGSSWSTIATIGIALLGIGQALGLSQGVIAGAIISGAYFGDKMSPLSDTTNLAPAVAGTDLFTHIRYMAYTTVPSIVIALILFLILGFTGEGSSDPQDVQAVLTAIESSFNLNPILFLVPVIVIVMIVRKIPALPALLVGALLGGIFAIIFQPQAIEQISGVSDNYLLASYKAMMQAMYGDIAIVTENSMVNDLLSSGGMAGMLNTIWLILVAMMFGGVMEASGMLSTITKVIIASFAKSDGSLIASTAVTCGFFNVTASDQYLAIVIPGKMYAETFKDRNLAPENLSRTLEDSATVTSVLVPWNTCGATQASVLGVATGTYLPYCFFNIISPFMTMLFGFLSIKIRKIKENKNDSE